MRTEVEAVSEQGAGLVTVAQAQLTVFWLGQQSPHCPEYVQTRLGQETPDRGHRLKERKCESADKVKQQTVCV